MKDYPNEEALRKAHRIYLDAMRPFIIRCLKKVQGRTLDDLISDVLDYEPSDDVETVIDINNIPLLIKNHWYDIFAKEFNADLNVQNTTWLIVEGRNFWAHPGTEDIDPESTRMHLSLAARVLGEIKNLNARQAVEAIRDQLFSDEVEEHPAEAENAAYKERLADMSEQFAKVQAEKKECERCLRDVQERLAELKEMETEWLAMSDQLEVAKGEQVASEEKYQAILNDLDTSEAKKKEFEEQLRSTSQQLEEMEAERLSCEERLQGTLKQLMDVKVEKDKLERHLEAEEKERIELEKQLENLRKQPKTLKTLEDRVEIGRKVAELRINAAGSKPLAWKKIREKLGLNNDEFHKVIRLEDHFKESVVERIESFEDGWEYGGKLKVLLGFEPVGELANRIEACKPAPGDTESPAKSPKSQRKWRRPGIVAALRDPTEIQEAEAKIAKILNPSEKARLERELREAKRAVDGSTIYSKVKK